MSLRKITLSDGELRSSLNEPDDKVQPFLLQKNSLYDDKLLVEALLRNLFSGVFSESFPICRTRKSDLGKHPIFIPSAGFLTRFQSCPLDVRSTARSGIASTRTLTRWVCIQRREIALHRIPDTQHENSEPS
jgi:hypothetical protein